MVEVRKLAASDDLSSFRCGNKDLDRWFKKFGGANQHLFGVTYVAIDGGAVVGFLTVASSSIARADVGGTTGPTHWPVLLLGRMAVVQDRQSKGIGKILMRKVFELAVAQYETTGCSFVLVDAKPGAVDYYSKYQFLRTPVIEPTSTSTRMTLEIGTVLLAMAT